MKPENESNGFATFYFYLQGVGSLIGWNAVLTTMDFFSEKFQFAEVPFVFPLPIFLANLAFCPFMLQISKFMSLNVRIAGALGALIVTLILLPVVTILMNNQVGFGITMVVLFLQGAVNTISTASCAGLTANFPKIYMSKLIAGYGLAGLMTNGVRALCLVAFSPKGTESIVVFYALACLITLLCIIVHLKFVKTGYAQYYMIKSSTGHIEYAEGEQDSSFTRSAQELNSQLIFDNKSSNSVISENIRYSSDGTIPPALVQAKRPGLISVWKEVSYFSILLVTTYVQTFMLFPGVALMKSLGGLEIAWSVLILITSYNIFDMFSRIMAGYRHHYNKYSITAMLIFRFLFFATFIILAKNQMSNFLTSDWFGVLNMGLFAGLNGYLTSALFIMGPEMVDGNKKETAGFIMQLSLYTGIIIGTFLSLSLTHINK